MLEHLKGYFMPNLCAKFSPLMIEREIWRVFPVAYPMATAAPMRIVWAASQTVSTTAGLMELVLVLLLGLVAAQNAKENSNPRGRRRLSAPKATSSVRVYATMLVQYTADNMDPVVATVLDSADQQRDNDDSGGEEQAPTTVLGEGEERFTGRSGTTTLTGKTLSAFDQCLMEEFIFTVTKAKAQVPSMATAISACGSILAAVILTLVLL